LRFFGALVSNRYPSLGRLPGNCPVTWLLILAGALTFLLTFVGAGAWAAGLAFNTRAWPGAPWSVVTYPLLGGGHPLWLLIGAYMMWLFGGSLERAWGRRDYVLFLALAAAVPALALWAGDAVTGRATALAGQWLPLAAVVVAWATINPYERLLAYFVLPVQARWMGIVAAGLVLFSFPFPLGVLAVTGCALAWWYASGGRLRLAGLGPGRQAPRRIRRARSGTTFNPLAWYRRWRMKREFMRLMRRIGPDDPRGPH
jgi:hypothetical protein